VADGYADGDFVNGGVRDGNGGGIHNSGTLVVSNSTLSGNSASVRQQTEPAVGYGGGIYGSVSWVQNTIVPNNTSALGGNVCFAWARIFPAIRQLFGVEPRGFEPLTSAVQSQIQNVVAVRCCSESAANKHILSSRLS
jgi:hypothetical protein